MRYLLLLLCLSCATESDVATWDTDLERDTTVRQTGASSIKFNAPNTGAIRSDYRPVIPGHPYRAFASIRDDDTGGAGDKLHLYIEWFTSAKVSISTDDVWPDSWPNTGDVWEEVSVIADAPATAAFCQLIADKTADDANGQEMWVDHFEIVPFPHSFFAYRGSDQSVLASDTVECDTELYDHGGWYDNAVNYRAVIPFDDVYSFAAGGQIEQLDADESFVVEIAFFTSGAAYKFGTFGTKTHSHAANQSYNSNATSGPVALEKGDLVIMRSYHGHGANLDLTGHATETWTFFSGAKVGR